VQMILSLSRTTRAVAPTGHELQLAAQPCRLEQHERRHASDPHEVAERRRSLSDERRCRHPGVSHGHDEPDAGEQRPETGEAPAGDALALAAEAATRNPPAAA